MKVNKKQLLKEVEGIKQFRSFSFNQSSTEQATRGVFDVDKRMVEFSLSSEEPYQRWFGNEVLGHNENEVDMKMLIGGPLLLEHDTSKLIGKIESARIENGRIIAIARFGKSALAKEIFDDVVDGIRGKISVGYYVKDMKEISEKGAEIPTFRVTSWVPIEGSSVPIPADPTVGVGRNLEDRSEPEEAKAEALEAPIVKAETAQSESVGKQTEILIIKEVKKMSDETINKKQLDNMLEMGKKFNKQDLASEFIRAGKSELELANEINNQFNANAQLFATNGEKAKTEIGMTKTEQKTWSFQGVLDAMIDGKKNFERELSDEVARKLGRTQKGERSIFIPLEMQKTKQARAMSQGTAGAGGYLVQTDLMSEDLVDVLRNETVSGQLGVTRLTGLRDTVNIPRVTVATSGSWVAESTAASEGSVTLDLIAMTPKTATANTLVSRKLRQQSSIDVMNFVPRELVQSLGITVDASFFNGTGASNQPTGIRNQSSINTITTATDGSAPTWAFMVQMESELTQDNALMGRGAYVCNAKTIGKLKVVEKATNTGLFLYNGTEMNGYPVYRTNQLPSNITKGSSGATLSTMLFGQWSNAYIGEWGVLEILVDPYYLSTAGSVRITGFYDYDVAVKHPESFCEMGSVITV